MSQATHASEEAESPTAIRTVTMELVVAAILFLLGAVVVVESRRLGAQWTSDGPGSGYFPFYIGLIICVCALGVVYQAAFGKARDTTSGFVDRQQLKQVASVFLPAAVYVLVINFLGLYVASALYIALFMIVLGKYPALKSVLVGVVVNVVFFMMFEVWFKVPLFKGSLDLLGFLGY